MSRSTRGTKGKRSRRSLRGVSGTSGASGGRPYRRPRVLVVAPVVPYPPDQGGHVRLLSLCERLRSRCSFSLLAYAPSAVVGDPVVAESLRLRLGAVFDEARWVPAEYAVSREFWFRNSDDEWRRHPEFTAMAEALQAWLKTDPPDLVHVEHARMAALGAFVRGVPAVLTEHDVGWVSFTRSVRPAAPGSDALARAACWGRRLVDYRRVCADFAGVVFTCEGDRRWWDVWGPWRPLAAVVPTSVDLERFAYRAPRDITGRPEILFVGHYIHPPNEEGARYFLDAVWPEILAAAPSARVTFVGPHPPAWLRGRAGGAVRVTGAVSDVLPLLRSGDVFVAPLRLGRGIKSKLLEAFAAGVPVVATSAALTGFDVTVAEIVRRADDPKVFAKETLNLLKNKSLREETARRARRWMEENHGWDRSVERLDEFYRAILREARRETDA